MRRFDAGDAYLFLPGEWHRQRPDPETGWSNLWLHFNGDLPHEWMRDGAFKLSHRPLAKRSYRNGFFVR